MTVQPNYAPLNPAPPNPTASANPRPADMAPPRPVPPLAAPNPAPPQSPQGQPQVQPQALAARSEPSPQISGTSAAAAPGPAGAANLNSPTGLGPETGKCCVPVEQYDQMKKWAENPNLPVGARTTMFGHTIEKLDTDGNFNDVQTASAAGGPSGRPLTGDVSSGGPQMNAGGQGTTPSAPGRPPSQANRPQIGPQPNPATQRTAAVTPPATNQGPPRTGTGDSGNIRLVPNRDDSRAARTERDLAEYQQQWKRWQKDRELADKFMRDYRDALDRASRRLIEEGKASREQLKKIADALDSLQKMIELHKGMLGDVPKDSIDPLKGQWDAPGAASNVLKLLVGVTRSYVDFKEGDLASVLVNLSKAGQAGVELAGNRNPPGAKSIVYIVEALVKRQQAWDASLAAFKKGDQDEGRVKMAKAFDADHDLQIKIALALLAGGVGGAANSDWALSVYSAASSVAKRAVPPPTDPKEARELEIKRAEMLARLAEQQFFEP
jgi:hypothetical protein